MKSFITGLFLILSFVFIGFVIAAAITGKYFVSTADGLAGGAIVFFYGLFGALAGLIAAVISLKKLKPAQKRVLAVVGMAIALLALFIIQQRFAEKKMEKEIERKELSPTDTV